MNETDIKTEQGAAVPFMRVSAINELRRRGLEALLEARLAKPRTLNIPPENRAYPYPSARLGGEANVTNRMAEAFYREHGVKQIDTALDLRSSLDGQCVMISAYCIRKEIGECLREKPTLQGNLYLRRGGLTCRLEFDCAQCRMRLIKESTR